MRSLNNWNSIALAAGLLGVIAGCAGRAPTDAPNAHTNEQAQTTRGATYTEALDGQGMSVVDTIAIAFDATTGTPSEIVCDETAPAGQPKCVERVCKGDEQSGTRYCFAIAYEGDRFVLKGTARRFEGDGDRVAIVIGDEDRMVGPIARGVQRIGGTLQGEDVAATLTVKDLRVSDRGEFILDVDFASEGPSGKTSLADLQLSFDTARSRFVGSGVSVGFDLETGLARSIDWPAAGGAFERSETVRAGADEETTLRLGGSIERWSLPWFDADSSVRGERCSAKHALLVDVVERSDRAKSMHVTMRRAWSMVRAPNGDVLAIGATRASREPSEKLVRRTYSPYHLKYELPSNMYTALYLDQSFVPIRTEGFGQFGWPHYLMSFPIDESCIAVRF